MRPRPEASLLKTRVGQAMMIVLLILMAWTLYAQRGQLTQLRGLTTRDLLLVFAIRTLAIVAFIHLQWVVTRALCPRLSANEYYALFGISFFSGQIAPLGPTALRAAHLSRHHGLRLRDYSVISLILSLKVLTASGILTLVALGAQTVISDNTVPLLFWLGATGSIAFGLAVPVLARRTAKWRSFTHLGDDLAEAAKVQQIAIWHLLALRGILSMATMGLIFFALTARIDMLTMGAAIEGLTSLLQIFRVTPGNLGVTEWSIGALSSITGQGPASGLLAALIYRLVTLTVTAGIALSALLAQFIRVLTIDS